MLLSGAEACRILKKPGAGREGLKTNERAEAVLGVVSRSSRLLFSSRLDKSASALHLPEKECITVLEKECIISSRKIMYLCIYTYKIYKHVFICRCV